MYKITTVEDQQKLAVPLNEITETINYNLRMIIDTKLYNPDAENRVWLLSKTKRISPNGICVATFTQDLFNQHHDYIEKDEDGNIVGMWADYFQSSVAPEEGVQQDTSLFSSITSKITTSGNNNQIRIGGQKTFTIHFYEDDEMIDHISGEWSFFIGEENVSDILSISYPADDKVRIKFNGDDNYIGKILSIKNTSEDIESSIDVEIIAL